MNLQKNCCFIDITDPTGKVVPYLYAGDEAKKSLKGLVQATNAFIGVGNSVVIDDVAILGSWQVNLWKAALVSHHVTYVGVHCPLFIIEERERKRGDRLLDSARGQFFQVHEGVEYDLEVNTHYESTDIIVNRILDQANQVAYH